MHIAPKSRPMLVLAPHTDDGEFGCGGTIAKFAEDGNEIFYAAFSLCEESLPEGWPKDTLEKEMREATGILGIPKDHLLIYRYPVRRFYEHRQDILENLVVLQKRLSPSLVFMPTQRDLHQDHQIIADEGIRAFKNTTILAYEMPWNNIDFSTRAFVKLSSRNMKTKLDALKCYKSQAHRSYSSPSFVDSLCHTRAVSIGSDYAECFDVVRLVLE